MTSADIRQSFLDFFASKQHAIDVIHEALAYLGHL